MLIPSYDTGPRRLLATIAEARRCWRPVWVVIDGSTDGSGEAAAELSRRDSGLRVIVRRRNGGKGAAVYDGICAAAAAGFTHVLVMDADGQHPAASIPEFMALSRSHPEAMILGVPVFDDSAPWVRVAGRRISNELVRLETLGRKIGDCLFGFRVYPIAPLREVMEQSRWMRRFDFDIEAVVRLSWRGVPAINRPAPVRYLRRRGRRFALSLWARQCSAGDDARAAGCGVFPAPAWAARGPDQIIPPLIDMSWPEM